MKYEKGNWKVMRDCCRSGMCTTCFLLPSKDRPTRVEHTSGVSRGWAMMVANNWTSYRAKAEPMPSTIVEDQPTPI